MQKLFMTSIFSIHNHKNKNQQNPILRATYFVILLAVISIPFLSRQAFASSYTGTAQIYVDGKTLNIASNALTVGDLIKEAGITLSEKDKIEPGLETEITDGYKVNIYRSVPITLEDKNSTIELESAYKTANAITEEAGTPLNPEDTYEFEASDLSVGDLKPGITLKVDRAESIKLNLYGAITDVRTQAKTVGEFLREKNIKLQPNDFLISSEETPILEGATLGVLNPFREIAVVDEEIPMPEELIKDVNKDISFKEIQTPGTTGSKRVTYEIKKENGVETSRLVVNEIITREPVKQISIVGGRKLSIANMNVSAQAKELMSTAGIPQSDQQMAYSIIQKESGWNYRATNKSSGAYGLCQALPGNKMADAGSDWESNPVTQLRWCNSYAKTCKKGRMYCGWSGAYSFWQNNRWW